MSRRAELVDETRQRIVEATVRLHTTRGPAETTVAAIAEAADVTRLTVYRHFPDLGQLFTACRAHWRTAHPGPDPTRWTEVRDLAGRARLGLSELYAWYRANAADLSPIYRDAGTMPPSSRAAMAATDEGLATALVGVGQGELSNPRLVAVAQHLVRFETWASLTASGALDDAGAADLGASLLALARVSSGRGADRAT